MYPITALTAPKAILSTIFRWAGQWTRAVKKRLFSVRRATHLSLYYPFAMAMPPFHGCNGDRQSFWDRQGSSISAIFSKDFTAQFMHLAELLKSSKETE